MPRNKQSNEERLAKARIARRNRYAKIKADPNLYALEREKEQQRYRKRREQKKILSAEELTPRARRLQRKKWREHFRRHYQKKKLEMKGLQHMTENTTSCGDSEENITPRKLHSESNPQPSTSNDLTESFIINMRTKLRKMRYILEKKDQMYKMHIKNLQRKNNTFRKIIMRLKKKLQSPNSKLNTLLQDKTKVKEVKKKILFGDVMRSKLEADFKNIKSRKEKRKFSEKVIGDKQVFKDLKVLSATDTFRVREIKNTVQRNFKHYEQLKKDIQNFFQRDDISRASSGKKEYITRKKERKQKRYLTDTIKNIHKLFKTECCDVSYSYFSKQRPFWVIIPNVNQRDTCVCKLHANMEFLIKALHKRGIISHNNSHDIIKSICCPKTEYLLKRCNLCKNKVIDYKEFDNDIPLTFKQWKNSTSTYVVNGIEKSKKIVVKSNVTVAPKQVINEFETIMPKFIRHEAIRRWQFSEVKYLKTHLKENEAIVHIDFSENYSFKYESEIQSFHFGGSRQELTLHTAVIYFIDDSGNLNNKSFCTVSENLRHDAAAVWAHIVPLLEFINSTNKKINTVHFLSDSPSSQYRNKTMFYIISKLHWYFHGLKIVSWNYSESAHGKGAADGVGAVVKRTADSAVAQGNDIVSLDEFMKVVRQNTNNVILKTIDEYQITEKDFLIPSELLKPLKNTMKVHQVLWQNEKDYLIFRETSCFVCLEIDCRHTKYIGKLQYDSNIECINITNKENENDRIINMTENVTTQTKRTKNTTVKILSNILVKSKRKTDENFVKLLSTLKPDNKLHLDPNIDIENMLHQYNISGSCSNFSGITQGNESALQKSTNETLVDQSKLCGSLVLHDNLSKALEFPGDPRNDDSDSDLNIF